MKKTLSAFAVLVVMTFPTLARATDPDTTPNQKRIDTKLDLFGSLGYLGSSGASGSAFTLGVRYGVGKHFAVSFDAGYGVLGLNSGPTVQDRWWLIPSVALVLPAGPVRFDIGAGFGLGATSGYDTFSQYAKEPFMPVWAFQLVPTVRGHAIASMPIGRKMDVFVRTDVATLLLPSGPHTNPTDAMWVQMAVGVSFNLF
jgi:hypothetical protein